MKKVLIVEDEKTIRNNLRFILEHGGYYCEVAENGFEGLEKVKALKPDMVLCDLMMPRMNGLQLLAEVHKIAECINIPFIFITALADEKDKRNAMNLGADDYITKPFNSKQLLETVEKRLKLAEKRNEVSLMETRTNAYNIFYTISSHEYLTPLNSIINFAEILVADNVNVLPKRSLKLLQHIEYSGKKLYHVTRKLFWYIKCIEQTEPPWQPKGSDNVSIHNMFLEQFELVTSTGYTVELEIEANEIELLHYKYADVELMAGELIENAVKFAVPKSAVKVALEADGGYVCLKVINAYDGVPYNTADITPLQKANSSSNWQGAGLGLYLLQRWSAAMGGRLSITGTGQLFTAVLTLPQSL